MRTFELNHGEVLDRLPELADCSIDACVTDPPYELGFMGKKWDSSGIANSVDLWREVLRVLKPGAYLLAFGATRTYHRMACAVEDAGFEIRDSLHWIYGSGFPKSLDVSKAMDKAAGVTREVVGHRYQPDIRGGSFQNRQRNGKSGNVPIADSIPSTDAAKQWDGWGTALKPSHEPIVLARKPLQEPTVAANVLAHGTGALNINGCRVDYTGKTDPRTFGGSWKTGKAARNVYEGGYAGKELGVSQTGRWPGNVIFDQDAAAELDLQSGDRKAGGSLNGSEPSRPAKNVYGEYADRRLWESYEDEGGASRFFYCAKASTSERGEGNNHPTVKPVDLMQYLCRLVTPPEGLILDPFLGSGTTGIAALREGFRFVGIDREAEYIEIARRRILGDSPLFNEEVA